MKQEVLESLIIKANEEYRFGNSIISDKRYDELFEILALKYPESSLLKKSIIEEFKGKERKQKLPIPMFSLNKEKSFEELKKWFNSVGFLEDDELVLTPKYDGISLCVNEENNDCWTRGNGIEGQKSNEHFSLINNLINENFGYTFGEAIMTKEIFNNKYKGEYKTARNYVAGLFNRKQAIYSLRDVDYIRYGIGKENCNKSIQIDNLNKINKVQVPYIKIKVKDLTKEILESFYQENNEIYQIDGVVIDIEDIQKRKNLGREENNNPKYARAYKNPDWADQYTTIVKDVIFNVSKQGKLKPIILIEPIDIDGVIIERVTGYNAKYIFDNNIAKASEIEIIRSGDVIPKHLKTFNYIDVNVESLADKIVECPICGELTKWDSTYTELVCTNINCEGRIISKLEHFFKTIEIEEFSRLSIIQLYKTGYKTIDKILNIDKEKLSNLEGWGIRSAEIVLNQFDKVKENGVSLAKLFHALDIFNGQIGEKTCQLILDNYDINEGIDAFSISELINIKGIANKIATIYKEGIENNYRGLFDNKILVTNEVIDGVLPIKVSFIQSIKKEILGDKYKDWKVCFTGIRNKELEEEIKNQGGEIVSGVSKKTTHLIVKDMEEKTLSSSKAKKAKELNIEIIPIEKMLF